MEDTSFIRKVLFNVLVILTILFIYYMFFPKKSYVDDKLKKLTSPNDMALFNTNMTNMEIASKIFFEENGEVRVTFGELIDRKFLVDDSSNASCSRDESYAFRDGNLIGIYLKCNGQEETKEIVLENKQDSVGEICIYQYEKKIEGDYSDWSEWSIWQKEEVVESDLIHVETKVLEEFTGTSIEKDYREVSIDAYVNSKSVCPEGYSDVDSKCVKRELLNSFDASISYTCPSGYSRNGFNCYKDGNTKNANKEYYCPSNTGNLEFVLSGDKCSAYNVTSRGYLNNQTYYTCPNGYELRGSKCYTKEYYEDEVENYEDVTYYRFQTRKKIDGNDEIKWSHVNDRDLINDGYDMTIEVFCGF